jgi:hypothetical protein
MLPLLLACTLFACTPETTDPLIEAGEDLLETFDPNTDPESGFASLNRFAAERPGLAADTAQGLVEAREDDTRYAAVYVLGLTADGEDELEALRRVADDPLSYLRAIAAGALIGVGEVDAIPALIDLLVATDEIPGSLPSTFVDRFASDVLTSYTGQDFGVREARGSAARAEAQGRWRDWFESVRGTIRWDPGSGRYVT